MSVTVNLKELVENKKLLYIHVYIFKKITTAVWIYIIFFQGKTNKRETGETHDSCQEMNNDIAEKW